MDERLEKECEGIFDAYNETINSKIVFVEKNISKILKSIAQNNSIYNLIAEKILGFNFEKEMQMALSINGEFLLPENKDKVIPLVFCLLNEIDNGKISAIKFIGETFHDDTEVGYKLFCDEVVTPFVMAIKSELGAEHIEINNEDNAEKTMLESLFTSDIISRMRYVVEAINQKMSELKKVNSEIKNDVATICYSIDLCLSEKEFLGVFGLFSGLKYSLSELKKFKSEINEINLLLEVLNNF